MYELDNTCSCVLMHMCACVHYEYCSLQGLYQQMSKKYHPNPIYVCNVYTYINNMYIYMCMCVCVCKQYIYIHTTNHVHLDRSVQCSMYMYMYMCIYTYIIYTYIYMHIYALTHVLIMDLRVCTDMSLVPLAALPAPAMSEIGGYQVQAVTHQS